MVLGILYLALYGALNPWFSETGLLSDAFQVCKKYERPSFDQYALGVALASYRVTETLIFMVHVLPTFE